MDTEKLISLLLIGVGFISALIPLWVGMLNRGGQDKDTTFKSFQALVNDLQEERNLLKEETMKYKGEMENLSKRITEHNLEILRLKESLEIKSKECSDELAKAQLQWEEKEKLYQSSIDELNEKIRKLENRLGERITTLKTKTEELKKQTGELRSEISGKLT